MDRVLVVALVVVGVILMFVLLTLAVGPLIMRVTPDRGDGRAAHGFELTREAAMEAFAKSWR